MQFSESYEPWEDVPAWVAFLIAFGLAWPQDNSGVRRIGLISMPCDSGAAGLLALGAMLNRLSLATANDLTSHFERMRAAATAKNNHDVLFNYKLRRRERGPWLIDGLGGYGMVRVKQITDPAHTRLVSLETSNNWQFSGEAPVQDLGGSQLPYARHYATLIPPALQLDARNLNRSDSGICLAGRVHGGKRTRTTLAQLRFHESDAIADLAQLLAVHEWMPGVVSRVCFFNARTGQLDRSTGRPKLVVVDGYGALARVLAKQEFDHSDVLAVYPRTMDRDSLEAFGLRLGTLTQWYTQDTVLMEAFSSPPPGLAVCILTRR